MMELTYEQYKIVNSDCKLNIAICCPGTGKTRVLTERIKRLYEDTKEPILACTFTNMACKEIESRLGQRNRNIQVRTLHSFCLDLVKRYWKEIGEIYAKTTWPAEPIICQDHQEKVLLSQLFPREDSEYLFEQIVKLRKLGVPPLVLLKLIKKNIFVNAGKDVIEKWNYYEKAKLSYGWIRFADMIELASLLVTMPNPLYELTTRYKHLLIDEAQDTSEYEWKIFRPIALNAKTTLVVGDYNQSIYGWRDADGSTLTGIADLKDAVVFTLEKSFRSAKEIAYFANKIARDTTSVIKTDNPNGNVFFRGFSSVKDEVNFVLSKIEPDSAILSRTNAYLEPFERGCIERSIPYQGSGFYRTEHIINMCKFLREFTEADALKVLVQYKTGNNANTKEEKSDYKLAVQIIDEIGISKFLSIQEKAICMPNDTGVNLSTGHGAKGLEWESVFLVGMNKDHLPHKSSNDIDEERNIFYVMLTRAKSSAVISFVGTPSIFIWGYLNGNN